LRRPIIVEGFGAVRVRRVCTGRYAAYAIGEAGELFLWGRGNVGLLGHGDERDQLSPKRVEAMRGIPISSIAVGALHALTLAEDGLVYAWGLNSSGDVLGNSDVERELLPMPVEALRGVRVSSVAATGWRSYAVADTGEVWAWGIDHDDSLPLGHGEQMDCPLPKPIESLRGFKVDAVDASILHTLELVDEGSVYAWGNTYGAQMGALGLGPSVSNAERPVPTPQRILGLRVACGL
jgi:alpha-tubulin suppressor-like RCC1 family protein